MGKCNITTWKFKELPLQDPQHPEQPATAGSNGNPYNHSKDNELFLVGYKYINQNNCPEVKIKLSDIMQGGNGSGDGGSESECECELALRYDNESHKLYYSLDGDTQGQSTNWISLAALDTSFNDIVFEWVEEESAQEAYVEGGKLHLKLKKQAIDNPGGGGGGTFPSTFPVEVDQNTADGDEPTGTYSNGKLTLHLKPGPTGANGIDGKDGEDGASFKLYKVKLDFTSTPRYEEMGVTNGITVYKLNASQTWYKYEPNSNTYTKIKTKPTIGNAYVEVGPSDIWKAGTNWTAASNYYIPGLNAHFNTFGFYNYSNQTFEFYSAGDAPNGISLAANTPLQFSVKVYENIKSADDEAAGSGDDPQDPNEPPVDSEYIYTITGNFDDAEPLLTNENLPNNINEKIGDGNYYYICNDEDISYDGNHLRVRIPVAKKISKVYQYNSNTWAAQTTDLGGFASPVSDSQYKTYSYTVPKGTGGYSHGTAFFCFEITDDNNSPEDETPNVEVTEGNDNP